MLPAYFQKAWNKKASQTNNHVIEKAQSINRAFLCEGSARRIQTVSIAQYKGNSNEEIMNQSPSALPRSFVAARKYG
jgi:hypothetical protein